MIYNLIKNQLIHYLSKEELLPSDSFQITIDSFKDHLKPCDVILVEGKSNFSKGIKYLTQSIWSHSAIYIGERAKDYGFDEGLVLFEADIEEGVRMLPLDFYKNFHVRICRPKITNDQANKLIDFLMPKVGHKYDLKHIFDLMKYLINPPIPNKYKRQYIEMGSTDASEVICSSIIAEAFHLIDYPILPIKEKEKFIKNNYKLITPKDYDVSPFFEVIKPRFNEFNKAEDLSETQKYIKAYGEIVFNQSLKSFAVRYPNRLIQIIKEHEANSYALKYCVMALAIGKDEKNLRNIISFKDNPDHYIKIGVYEALKEYWNVDKNYNKVILESLNTEIETTTNEELKQHLMKILDDLISFK